MARQVPIAAAVTLGLLAAMAAADPVPLLVPIDIMPGTYPNTINLGTHELVPVAVFSQPDYFDATTIDPATVTLAGASVAAPAYRSDVNGDGWLDLVLRFDSGDIDSGAIQDGRATLTGSTFDGVAIEGSDEVVLVMTVPIDIKPGTYPNIINLGSHGTVHVAVFSLPGFDATTLDPATVTLAGAGVALRGSGKHYMTSVSDVNGDGLVDLVLHFDTQSIDPAAIHDGQAVLTGQTSGGAAIQGSDVVVLVPSK